MREWWLRMELWGGGGRAARQPWEPPAHAKRASARRLYTTTPLEMNDIDPGKIVRHAPPTYVWTLTPECGQ